MKRAILAAVLTVAGLAALLGFKTEPITTGSPAAGAGPRIVPGGVSPSSNPHRSTGPSRPAATRARTVTGGTAQTPYGPVQVRVTERAGRIADVTAVQLPNTNANSIQIAQYAVPILRHEAIRQNSAHIDAVSGATYTSEGYAQSLQSALDNLSS